MSHRRYRVLTYIAFSFLFLIAFTSQSIFSQQPEPSADASTPTIVSTTRIVTLDVVVTDAAGHPVANLNQEDFSVQEDGAPQKIAVFETPNLHLEANNNDSGSKDVVETSATRPLTIIMLDEMNTKFENIVFARTAIKHFLEQHDGKLEQPTALMTLTNTNLVLVHDYTQNGKELITAVDHIPAMLPWHVQKGTHLLDEAERFVKTEGALHDVALASKGYPGRKNIIWLGSPFRKLSTVAGVDNSLRIQQSKDLSNLLLESHVTLYTIDPAGLQPMIPVDYAETYSGIGSLGGKGVVHSVSAPGTIGAPGHTNFGLDTVALETGGQVVYEENDIDRKLGTDVAEGNTYYTLAYYPSNHEWNGAFRKLKVQVNHPGYKVRARLGYYGAATPAPPTAEEVRFELARAVANPLTYTQTKLKAVAIGARNKDGHAQFTLQMDPAGLSWETLPNNNRACKVTVVVAALSHDGEILHYTSQNVEGTSSSPHLDLNKTVSFKIDGLIPPKTASIRVVVRDSASGRIGSANLTPPEMPQT